MTKEQQTAKHTPGPWQADPSEGVYDPVSGSEIAHVRCIENWHGDEEDMTITSEEALANTYLIAAAPELLEELKHAHKIIQALINVMTEAQRAEISKLDEGEGALRYHVRKEAIAKAENQA